MKIKDIPNFLNVFTSVMVDLGFEKPSKYFPCGSNSYRIMWLDSKHDSKLISTQLWFLPRTVKEDSDIERIRLASSDEALIEPVILKASVFPKNWERNDWEVVRLLANIVLNHYSYFLNEEEIYSLREKPSPEEVLNKWGSGYFNVVEI